MLSDDLDLTSAGSEFQAAGPANEKPSARHLVRVGPLNLYLCPAPGKGEYPLCTFLFSSNRGVENLSLS